MKGLLLSITIRAVCVLETETGLVSLCNPGAIQSQQVVVREHLDAVVVSGTPKGKDQVSVCAECGLFSLAEHWLPMTHIPMTSPPNMGVTITPLTRVCFSISEG